LPEFGTAAAASASNGATGVPRVEPAGASASVSDAVQGGTEEDYAPPCTSEDGSTAGVLPANRTAELGSAWTGEAAVTTRVDPRRSDFVPGEFFSAFLSQLYLGQPYVPRNIYVPTEFEDRTM